MLVGLYLKQALKTFQERRISEEEADVLISFSFLLKFGSASSSIETNLKAL